MALKMNNEEKRKYLKEHLSMERNSRKKALEMAMDRIIHQFETDFHRKMNQIPQQVLNMPVDEFMKQAIKLKTADNSSAPKESTASSDSATEEEETIAVKEEGEEEITEHSESAFVDMDMSLTVSDNMIDISDVKPVKAKKSKPPPSSRRTRNSKFKTPISKRSATPKWLATPIRMNTSKKDLSKSEGGVVSQTQLYTAKGNPMPFQPNKMTDEIREAIRLQIEQLQAIID